MDSFARPTIFQHCEILPKQIRFHVASQEIAFAIKFEWISEDGGEVLMSS